MFRNGLEEAMGWVIEHRRVNFDTGCWELDTHLHGAEGKKQYSIPRQLALLVGFPEQVTYTARQFIAKVFLGYDPNERQAIFVKCDNRLCCNYLHLRIGVNPKSTKECFRCKRVKNEKTEFYWKNGASFSWCKECFREYVREWNRKATQKRETVNRKLDRRSLRRREARISQRSGVVSLVRVLQRDKGICHICLREIRSLEGDMHFDHVVPLSRGGMHEEGNVKLAHVACNLWKGVALLEELESRGLVQVRETGRVPEDLCYSRLETLHV